MNYNISELNELAQSVCHCLKHLKPNTMFWNTVNHAAFTNHDRFEVQPYRDLKKPFGKQAILESFARSLGFKTYNGLMESGIERFELTKNALLDLNPNPLNLLLTDCWEAITRCLMERLLETKILTPSRLGNFKQNKLSQYAVFCKFNEVSPLKWIDSNSYKTNDFKLKEFYEGVLPMIGIADAIFHHGLDVYIESKGVKEWFDAPEIDEQAYLNFLRKYQGKTKKDVVVVKLADVLAKKEGIDRNYVYILEAIQLAFSLLYDTQLEFTGGMKNGKHDYLEIELNFYFPPALIGRYMSARIYEQNNRNYQAACALLLEKYKDDAGLYASEDSGTTLERYYTAQDLENKISFTGLRSVNYGNLGKKAYWINNSLHTFFTESSLSNLNEGLMWEKEISFEAYVKRIERFLDEQLKPIKFKQMLTLQHTTKAKYEYKYKLIRTGSFAQRFPDSIVITSDYPLKHHLGELFVQTILLNEIGFDDEDKFIGKPDLLAVGLDWTVKIQQTKSVREAQQSYKFEPIALIRSLFLYVEDYRDGIAFQEDHDTVAFNIGLKFIDVLYQFMRNDEYENIHESTNLVLRLSMNMNKCTNEIRAKADGEYSIGYFESTPDIDFGNEDCPITQEIADYLMQFDGLKELISKYCSRFYNGDKKEAYEEAINGDEMDFEIRPIELIKKGLSLEEIANSEPYIH